MIINIVEVNILKLLVTCSLPIHFAVANKGKIQNTMFGSNLRYIYCSYMFLPAYVQTDYYTLILILFLFRMSIRIEIGGTLCWWYCYTDNTDETCIHGI